MLSHPTLRQGMHSLNLTAVTQAYGINLFLCAPQTYRIDQLLCLLVMDISKAYRLRMDQAQGGKGWH